MLSIATPQRERERQRDRERKRFFFVLSQNVADVDVGLSIYSLRFLTREISPHHDT